MDIIKKGLKLAILLCLAPSLIFSQEKDWRNGPVNKPILVDRTKLGGGRASPILFYATQSKRFVLSGGVPSRSYSKPVARFYDNEEFDLQTLTWINAYPKGMEVGRPVSGTIPEWNKKILSGHRLFEKDGDFFQLKPCIDGYGKDSRAFNMFAYIPEQNQLYAYLWKQTIRYDVKRRSWETLKATYGKGYHLWGSLAYDPINKELISATGASESNNGVHGTWAYSLEKNTWRKLIQGSPAFRKNHTQSKKLILEVWDLLSAARNRFWIVENKKESEQDLNVRCKGLIDKLLIFHKELLASEVLPNEKEALKRGSLVLNKVIAGLEKYSPLLSNNIDKGLLRDFSDTYQLMEKATYILSPEPSPRGQTPLVYDAKNKKLVMFGGNSQDSMYADTWIYDCTKRTWQQKWPSISPSPRGAHSLVYLPKSGKILLAGGVGLERKYKSIPFEYWTYDTQKNEWGCLLHVPLKKVTINNRQYIESPNCPIGNQDFNWIGAANEDDVLVMVDGGNRSNRQTFVTNVKPNEVDSALTKKFGVAPMTMSYSISPTEWEKVAMIDTKKTKNLYQNLPENKWVKIASPKHVHFRAWGTSAYDPERHQFTFWSGGHSTTLEPDVAHFSIRAQHWTVGFTYEQAQQPSLTTTMKTRLTYKGRLNVPLHSWRGYSYGGNGMMVTQEKTYDTVKRRWLPKMYSSEFYKNKSYMHNVVRYCYGLGAIAWSKSGLYLYVAKIDDWNKLEIKGSVKLNSTMYCDGASIIFDSKRNGIWLAGMRNSPFQFYDFKTKMLRVVQAQRPKCLGKKTLGTEGCYLPDDDIILAMRLFKGSNGKMQQVGFDIATEKYIFIETPFYENGAPVKKLPKWSWSDSMAYDRELKRLFINNNPRGIWALNFQRKTAKIHIVEKGD